MGAQYGDLKQEQSMRKVLMAVALATASFAATGAAMASQVTIAANNPVIDLSVSESVTAKPDMAGFSTGVQTMAPTATEAVRQNNAQMAAVIAKLTKLGIAEKDIQTTQINLNQHFDYANGNPVFKGYQASNMVNVKLRDLRKLGDFLDALASDGATNFNGPVFSVDNERPLLDAARDKVWKTATERALSFAKKAGYANVRVIRVEENGSGNFPIPYGADVQSARAESKNTPIAPGEISVTAALSFTFEMVK
jgi:uncharacterized protein YggE